MKTLIAHEWIEEVGGAENVFEQMRLAIPHNRAVCLWKDGDSRFSDVEESWLAASPMHGRKAVAMPFMGSAWNHVDLTGADRVIASSHAFSHHLASRAASAGIPAFAYVHSPARYVWAPEVDNRGNSLAGRLGRSYFRGWDRRHTSREVNYAANSNFVAQRIADAWGQEASVIYPPVDVDRIRAHVPGDFGVENSVVGALPTEFVLGASRLVHYKNLDAAIRAGEILKLPVVLAGAGPDEKRLRSIAECARVPVTFTGRVSDNLLIELYRRAALFVYMSVEDFGIMPVEATTCGTPALVNSVGGARESALATGGGTTAVWRESRFEDPAVVKKALGLDMTAARSAVAMFSNASFKANVLSWLNENN